jgi:hypothetical protein
MSLRTFQEELIAGMMVAASTLETSVKILSDYTAQQPRRQPSSPPKSSSSFRMCGHISLYAKQVKSFVRSHV